MKRKRHTPEDIIKKLRTAEEALAGGKTVEDACRLIAVSIATYQRWKSQYSGVKKDALKRLKELEKEHAQHPTSERLPWDWRLLVNGKGDAMLFD
jgi:transposase-like protein